MARAAIALQAGASETDSEARDRILHAAFRLFMEKGFAGASTLEIATRAKVSKRDLYALVGNKQQIFRACVATRASRMAALDTGPPPATRAELEAALTRLGDGLLRELTHPAVVGVHRLVIADAGRSPELAAELGRVREGNKATLARLFAAGQGRGLVAAGDTDAMAEQFLDLLAGSRLLLRALASNTSPSPDETERQACAAAAAFIKLHGD